jgi:hypothetical protein
MTPGRLSRFLLLTVAGAAEAEFVDGDLYEEFSALVKCRGPRAARHWYFRQVIRSIVPLLTLRIRSGEFTRALLAAAAAVVPLAALDRLWSFVYSQIPLKDSLDRAPVLLAINVTLLAMSAAVAGSMVKTRPQAVATSALSALLAGLVLWIAPGSAPALYVLSVLAAAPTGCMAAFRWRSSR